MDVDSRPEPLFSKRRVRNMIVGSVVAVVLGVALANLYTYTQYGGTIFDGLLKREKPQSPMAGKFAYAKGTGYYLGVIKGEGKSPRRGEVYYIEQAGGVLIEVAKDRVEVREPER